MAEAGKAMHKVFLIFIRAYQTVLSPLMGQNCRFYPSCSCYAHTAIERFGVLKGSYMALRRIMRCHPWHPGGLDPVPELETDLKKK